MRLHMKHDIKIARWGADPSRIALLLITDACAVLYARRNCNVDGAFVHHASVALALVARIGNDAAHPLTRGAGARDGKEALLITNLAPAATGGAGAWALAFSSTAAVALLATFIATHLDLRLFSEGCFFKSQVEIGPSVASALCPATAPTAAHVHTEEI